MQATRAAVGSNDGRARDENYSGVYSLSEYRNIREKIFATLNTSKGSFIVTVGTFRSRIAKKTELSEFGGQMETDGRVCVVKFIWMVIPGDAGLRLNVTDVCSCLGPRDY